MLSFWESRDEDLKRDWIIEQDLAFCAAVRELHFAPPPEPEPVPEPEPEEPPDPIDEANDPFRWKAILYEVAEKHKLAVPKLLAHRRGMEIVNARAELWFRLYNETTLSLPAIGRKTGGFDHSSVITGIRRYKKVLAGEPVHKKPKRLDA